MNSSADRGARRAGSGAARGAWLWRGAALALITITAAPALSADATGALAFVEEPAPHYPHRAAIVEPLLNQPAPSLESVRWRGESPVSLDALRGRIVIVMFWAGWANAYVNDVTATEALYQAHRARGVEVVGIHASWQAEELERFIGLHPLSFPLGVDESGQAMRLWRADSFPDYYLLDGDGILRLADVENARLEQALEWMFERYPPSAASE